jgi:C-terminal processing protease CtpA/Prc
MLRTKLRTWGLVVIGGFLLAPGWCQKIADFDREYAKAMLKQISSDVRKHYYDPRLHGLEWDSSVREMEQLIDRAETTDDALSQVAALLDSLKDSHTFFLPPQRPYHLDYGWRAQMIGDHCYIVRVRPGSDADAKGVKRGDEVLAINGYTPVRNNFSKLEYVFNTLRPQRSLRLFLRDPAGKKSTVEALANVTSMNAAKQMTWDLGGNQRHDAVLETEERVHEARPRIAEMGDELMILKLSAFFFSQAETDSLMGKARKHKFLIIDVRGNPGGSIDALKYLIGGLFERDVTIGDRVSRGERKPIIARTHGQFFEGKLLVLVDNMSASASELLARVVQLEKRGIVLGDTTAGKVMESKLYTYKTGAGTVVLYGASITDADIIMTDGSSLERAGVTPDERVLPTAADLAEGHDPVLAHAAEAASVKLSPDSAGKLFPYEWPRRSMGDD